MEIDCPELFQVYPKPEGTLHSNSALYGAGFTGALATHISVEIFLPSCMMVHSVIPKAPKYQFAVTSPFVMEKEKLQS